MTRSKRNKIGAPVDKLAVNLENVEQGLEVSTSHPALSDRVNGLILSEIRDNLLNLYLPIDEAMRSIQYDGER